MKKSTTGKMYWYAYNNTVPLLNIAKTQIFYPIYNLKKIKLALFHLLACQLQDLVALVLWLLIFYTRKVIVSSLRICYSEEGSSTAPWSFFLSVASSFLFYSLVKG